MSPIITTSSVYKDCISDTVEVNERDWHALVQKKFNIPDEVLEWTSVPYLTDCNLLISILCYYNYLNVSNEFICTVAKNLGEESEKQEYNSSELPLELLWLVIEQWPSLYYSPNMDKLCEFSENKELYFQRNKIGLVSIWRHNKEQLENTFIDYCKYGNYEMVKYLLPTDEKELSRGYERACELNRTEIVKLLVPIFSEEYQNNYVLSSGLAAAVENSNCELFHYFKSRLNQDCVISILEDNILSMIDYDEENDISNFTLNNCDLTRSDMFRVAKDKEFQSNFVINYTKIMVEKFQVDVVPHEIILSDKFIEFLPWFIDRDVVNSDALLFAIENHKIQAVKVLLKIPKFRSEIDDIYFYKYKWWSLITCGDEELYDLLLPIFQRNEKIYNKTSLIEKYIESSDSTNISQEIFVHILTTQDKSNLNVRKSDMIIASKRGHTFILEYMFKNFDLDVFPNKLSLALGHHYLWEQYYYLYLENYREDKWQHEE